MSEKVVAADLRAGMCVRTLAFNCRPVWLPLADRPQFDRARNAYRVCFAVPRELSGKAPGWFWAKPTSQLTVRRAQ